MLSDIDVELCLSLYLCAANTAPLAKFSSQPANRREHGIDRLKQRIENLVKLNDEKERKIEDLRSQLTKYQTTNISQISSKNTNIAYSSVTNHHIQTSAYVTDIHISDTASLPSLGSDKDSKTQTSLVPHYDHHVFTNPYQNPLSRLKVDLLHRASSAEPMLIRERISASGGDALDKNRTILPNKLINQKHDQSGYMSDGLSRKHSMYYESISTNLNKNKSSSAKGLKSIFEKITQTHSRHFPEDDTQQLQDSFNRRALQATINDGKFSLKPLNSIETRFAHWHIEQIVNWLYGIGLGQYASELRRYFKNGLQLLNATSQELEKKIGMRNPLHRKKLQICLNDLCTGPTAVIHLDTRWVLLWLDDIGLPQYKDYFAESKIDGSVLNNLTLEDIIYLNITNELHFLSIKHSIQILRLSNFNANCMKRRPTSSETHDINEIMYWSNHRIMEWLRSIDLSEYAPNLRGSGVSGALIVLELRFNTSTLAEILSIPASKTLLRRHLAMHFQELIGSDLYNRKSKYEQSSNYQLLTLHSKLKFSRGLFSHRRAYSIDNNDLICPVNDDTVTNVISPNFKFALAHDTPTTVV